MQPKSDTSCIKLTFVSNALWVDLCPECFSAGEMNIACIIRYAEILVNSLVAMITQGQQTVNIKCHPAWSVLLQHPF